MILHIKRKRERKEKKFDLQEETETDCAVLHKNVSRRIAEYNKKREKRKISLICSRQRIS